MQSFYAKCPAKINLFLKLVGKCDDGYHELESLFAFLDLFDELEVKKSDEFKLEIIGEFAQFIDAENNLFTRILDFFSQKFNISNNLHIKITKNIPVGAGLGGGSSNAAYFMMALNEIFSLKLNKSQLQQISLEFGSDIAFLLEKQASIVGGRGEFITNYPKFTEITALLVNPRVPILTKEVFEGFNGYFSTKVDVKTLLKADINDLLSDFPNDMEGPAIEKLPLISDILVNLRHFGAKTAKMSGSGASCFGIFANEESLDVAEKNFLKNHPNFFVKKVKIKSNV